MGAGLRLCYHGDARWLSAGGTSRPAHYNTAYTTAIMPAGHVLIVEDNHEMRRLVVEALLRPQEYRCSQAADGLAGLALAREAAPDLVVTDMYMPGMNGLELIQTLHAERPDLPCILITAEGSEVLASQAFRSGAVDYLIKPFALEDLALTIERALADGQTRRATARRMADLEATNVALEAMAIEYARRYAEADHARRKLENVRAAKRLKSDTVTTLAHDVRSPLTAIWGYVSLLEQAGPLTAQQAQFVRRIESNVKWVDGLIADLLNVEAIEASTDGPRGPVSLAAVIHRAVDGVRPRAQDKRQSLAVRVEAGLPLVLADEDRLRQLFGSLLEDAIAYAPAGGEVSLGAAAAGDQVVITVADTGPGAGSNGHSMAADEAGHRASGTNGRSPRLSTTVRSIVDRHGGRVWIDSKPGHPSTLTVVLPTAKDA